MKTRIIDPIQSSGWNDLLLTNKQSCFFHSSNWAQVIKDSYNYNPVYFVLENNQKLLSLIAMMEIKHPIFKNRGVSLPFTDCCCPIVNNESQFRMLFNKIVETGRKSHWEYFELRGGQILMHSLKAEPYDNYYMHTINISSDIGCLKRSLRDSTRRNIKKAIKNGIHTELSYSADSIQEFYRLNCLTRKYHGLPPQPFFFFKNINKHVISQKLGFVILAKYKDKVIAGAVYFLFGKKAIFKYGASDKRYHYLRPNNLIMWRAIVWCANNGYDNFSMGRTQLNNNGLSQFKDGWGTTRTKISYFRYNMLQNHFNKKDSYNPFLLFKISKSIPIPMLKLVGSLAYKYIG